MGDMDWLIHTLLATDATTLTELQFHVQAVRSVKLTQLYFSIIHMLMLDMLPQLLDTLEPLSLSSHALTLMEKRLTVPKDTRMLPLPTSYLPFGEERREKLTQYISETSKLKKLNMKASTSFQLLELLLVSMDTQLLLTPLPKYHVKKLFNVKILNVYTKVHKWASIFISL